VDPAGVYTPAEYVDLQLKSPEVQEVVKTLSPDDLETFNILKSRLASARGHTDLLALNNIGEFLEEKGVDLDLPDSFFEPTEKAPLFREYTDPRE
jgi:hypothetical protein